MSDYDKFPHAKMKENEEIKRIGEKAIERIRPDENERRKVKAVIDFIIAKITKNFWRFYLAMGWIATDVLIVSKVPKGNLGEGVSPNQIRSVRCRFRMALNTMNFYFSYGPIQVAVIDVFFHIDQ